MAKKKNQMGFYDYSPQEVKDSLGTTEAKIALIGGETGFDDQISVDVTPEESTTFISKVDQNGNRRPGTEKTIFVRPTEDKFTSTSYNEPIGPVFDEDYLRERDFSLLDNFGKFGEEIDMNPIDFVNHHFDIASKGGPIHPAVSLMISDNPEEHSIAMKVLMNQKEGHYYDYKLNPRERAIYNGEPISVGPPTETASTGEKAKAAGAYEDKFKGNPIELAQMAYQRMVNLEIGKLWKLDDGLLNLKNKDGDSILEQEQKQEEN
jgi:hypothetical protein